MGASVASAGLVPSETSVRALVGEGEFFSPTDAFARSRKRLSRLRRSIWWAGRWHSLPTRGHRPDVPWFVTLTYADPDAWRPRHLSDAFKVFRRWCKSCRVPCRYVWVAEIQPKRFEVTGDAVVHYHLVVWLPHGVVMPTWDQPHGKRSAFWPHGMTNRDKAHAGVGYLMKYLSKLGEWLIFPPGLRIYGIGGLDVQGRQGCSWLNLPEWAKRSHGVGDLIRLAGRLVVRATGEVLKAPWAVRLVSGGVILSATRPIPERFHEGPYSSFVCRGAS